DVTALRTGGRRGLAAELHLRVEERVHAVRIHDHEHDVSRLGAELEAETPTFERIHGRRAPGAVKRLAGAADHGALAVAAADTDGHLGHRGNHDDALRFIEHFLR